MTTKLEIRNKHGKRVGTKVLSREKPLSIGRHQGNDIMINDAAIGALHCRIGWKDTAFEVVAATSSGVEVNGQLVQRRMLEHGDVLRIGSFDLKVLVDRSGEAKPAAAGSPDDDFDLVPLDDDEIPPFEDELEDDGEELRLDPAYYKQVEEAERRAAAEAKKKSRKKKAAQPVPAEDVFETDEADGAGADDAAVAGQVLPRRRSVEEGDVPTPPSGRPGVRAAGESLIGTLRERITEKRRPGEEDVVRSPFIIGLGVAALVLLLAAATFWFIIGRETVQRQLSAARAARDSGRYTQAIALYEDFLLNHYRHELADQVRVELGTTRIDKEIAGSTPSWKGGLQMLERLIDENRDRDDFAELHPTICDYAFRIALGAARQAEKARDRELLEVSNQATTLLVRYSPKDQPPVEQQREIRDALEKAEAAILKKETLDEALADIDAALEAKQPMRALQRRLELLDRYPELESHPEVVARMQRALDTERALIREEAFSTDARHDDHPDVQIPGLVLAANNRAMSNVRPVGRVVPAVARDSVYGVDIETGDVLWRRVTGLDGPFFPVLVESATEGVLLYDTRHKELVLLERSSGRLQWRQPLDEEISGAPLVADGQIYLPTLDRHVYKINLESGRITGRLTFTQRLRASPVLLRDGEHLAVIGDASVLYVLTTRPLRCLSVTFTGHRADSVQAPLLAMGELLMFAENTGPQAGRLRVFRTDTPDGPLEEVATVDVPGPVRDAPVLRGKQLFVPLPGERLLAFTVSDDPNQKPLTAIARIMDRSDYDGPIYLLPGPDNQLWMGSRALKRFQLDIAALHPDPRRLSEGQIAQPLLAVGTRLFVARFLPATRAVALIAADGPEMSSQWKTVLGSRVLAWLPTERGGSLAFLESGDVFYVGRTDLRASFKQRPDVQLRLPEGLASRLAAVRADGQRVIVYCGAAEPSGWIVNRNGQIERRVRFTAPLSAPPVLLAAGVVAPLPGRLELVPLKTGAKTEPLLLPAGDVDVPAWTCVVRRNDSECLAVQQNGQVRRVQYRPQPTPHLYSVDDIRLDASIDIPAAAADDRLYVATSAGTIAAVDAGNLEIVAQITLRGTPTNAVWVSGGLVFAELDAARLVCLDPQAGLKTVWSLELEGDGLAGGPLVVAEDVYLAQRGGIVMRVNRADGEILARARLPQRLDGSPTELGDAVVATAVDGTVYRIDELLAASAPAGKSSARRDGAGDANTGGPAKPTTGAEDSGES
ncbi:MAG: FHA domain-containing protein [Planctomycetota bacterium]|nr:MAG: FHA domain-containing protein [Planctomycetota bacterium]